MLVTVGDSVAAGQVLARLTTNRLQADLARAEEEFHRAEREFDNAKELLERGGATVDCVVSARAALATARAGRTAAEEAFEAARVEAAFDGRIERFELDEGEFISAGSDAGRIVDNQPLTVTFQLPQRSQARLQGAGEAEVTFITGQRRPGRITFVGTSAQADTRTFRADVMVENGDGAIPSGLSAEIRLPRGQARAHFIAPSIVSLDTDSEIGAKTVEEGRVVFHPIEIVRAEVDGLWVTGLPDRAQLIIIGQGYVQDGEGVRATPEDAPGEAPADMADDTADQP